MKSLRVKESKSQRVKETKSQREEETKGQRRARFDGKFTLATQGHKETKRLRVKGLRVKETRR